MCNIAKCFLVACTILSRIVVSTEVPRSSKLLFSEQEIVDELVKKWSPLVWLAPNEKYLPGNVKTFLANVHAEREKPNSQKVKDIGDNLNKYSHYYEDLVYYEGAESKTGTSTQNNRKRRNFDKDTSLEYIFELPIDGASEDWFLVTNEDIDSLMKNKSSFIYGEKPNSVAIYAVVSMCSSDKDFNFKNEIENGNKWKKNPYIPLTKNPDIQEYANSLHMLPNKPPVKEFRPLDELEKASANEIDVDKFSSQQFLRRKRSDDKNVKINNETQSQLTFDSINNFNKSSENAWRVPSVIIYTKDEKIVIPTTPQKDDKQQPVATTNPSLPHFHVSYWMFYPFSEGKTICTLNLGVLGPIPIPLIWNMCLGTRKEFGSHVGDWEHISIVFRGRMEPDEMYVSAHEVGAYYTYDRLTGTFEYKRQEVRKGIFQFVTFPKTVVTSENHPVLFAAEGSHGLWGMPGKHKYARVPRLYDINGFGEPWETWKNVEIIYNDSRSKRSINPNWMKYRGKWGNPKNRCLPLKRIGLHICEQSDGPTGIPKKTSPFKCSA